MLVITALIVYITVQVKELFTLSELISTKSYCRM